MSLKWTTGYSLTFFFYSKTFPPLLWFLSRHPIPDAAADTHDKALSTNPVIWTFWWCKWDHLVREIPAALQQQVCRNLKAQINRRALLSRIKGFPAQFMIHHLDCFHLTSFHASQGRNIPSRESTHPPAHSEPPPPPPFVVLFFYRGDRRDDDKH